MSRRRPVRTTLVVFALLTTVAVLADDVETDAAPMHVVIAGEAEAARSIVATSLGRAYLDAAACLPAVETRTIYRRKSDRAAMTLVEHAAATEDDRAGFEALELDETFYYTTRYGTPIANVRAYDLAGAHGLASADGARIADFGFGSIGSLRMLASLGAHVVGIEIDEMLRALYAEPHDTGVVPRCAEAGDGPNGSLTLAFGRWPGGDDVRRAVDAAGGDGFDLFLSKNTLKRGYIHPTQAFRSRAAGDGLIDLGSPDEAFVRAVHDALRPGGLFLIYNLSPKLDEAPDAYLPWADGRCPFDRALLERVGFEVIALDVDDTPMARIMARALEWDDGGMDVEGNLFARYTLLRRRP